MLDQDTNTIVSMSAAQVTEAGNLNNMKNFGLIKTLNSLKEKHAQIK